MEGFWGFMKIAVIAGTLILALLLVLLALPKCRLRPVFLRVFGIFMFCVSGLAVLYIISPADLLPDIIPLLGQVDDLGALVLAVINAFGGTAALFLGRQYKSVDLERDTPEVEKIPPSAKRRKRLPE